MVKLVGLLDQSFGRVERFKIHARHISQAGWPRGRDHRARVFGVAALVARARAAVRGRSWLPLAWLWPGHRWPRRVEPLLLPSAPCCCYRRHRDAVLRCCRSLYHRVHVGCPGYTRAVASP